MIDGQFAEHGVEGGRAGILHGDLECRLANVGVDARQIDRAGPVESEGAAPFACSVIITWATRVAEVADGPR